MSFPKTKIVEVGEWRYQIRRMNPEDGSYILMKMLAAGIQSGGEPSPQSTQPEKAVTPAAEPSGEELVRIMAFSAFLRGLDHSTHAFIQKKCISLCSRMEGGDGKELPMPIMNDSGQWAIHDVRDDIALVMKLEVEALVFNLSDFFESGGLDALAKAPAAPRP